MTREEKLVSMRGVDLLKVAENLGIKVSKNELKKGKGPLIQKIIKAEAELAVDGTPLAEVGKEIAEQAKLKAEDHKLVPMPGIEKLEELKNEITDHPVKTKKSERKSLRLKEVTYKGEAKSIREWATETGMPWRTLYNRINNNGWPVDLAIETPIGERKPRIEEA